MKPIDRAVVVNGLLAFNGGFVDAAGFLGLQGLFVSHVTGNFVTLGAALVLGSHGVYGKLLALPEFVAVVALARLAGATLRARKLPVLRLLFSAEAVLLIAFCVFAVWYGPFADPDSVPALITGFIGIAAMAIQNAVQRVHFSDQPPTTIMTGNTTQATLDAVDLLAGAGQGPLVRARFVRIALSIVIFGIGCAAAALSYWLVGFWCLALSAAVGAIVAVITPSGQAT